MASRSSSTKSRSSRKRHNSGKSPSASAPVSADNDQPQAVERSNSWPRSSDNEIQLEDLQGKPLNIEPKDDRASTIGDPPVAPPGQGLPAPPPAPQIGTLSAPPDPIPPRDDDHQQKTGESITRKDESTGPVNSVQRVLIESERTGWAKLYDLVRQFDKDRVEDIKDDIDTLLVFAGLFSAVVTAFIIESYKNLQPQSDDTSAQVLLHISAQLASLSINGNFINSTVSSFTPTPSPQPRFTILINTLWASSLIIALITASIGILVKQWFHELMAYTTHDPQERLKLRFFRERGLERWKVFAIASSLPILLQLALLLFFIGFALFFHDLDIIIGWIITGIIIGWLAAFVFTTVTPAFSSQCPYKTPMLKGLLTQIRSLPMTLASISHRLIITIHRKIPYPWNNIPTFFWKLSNKSKKWPDKLKALEEEQVSKDGSLSMPIISSAKDLLRGERLNGPIRECVGTISAKDYKATLQGLKNKQSPVDSGLIPQMPWDVKDMVTFILGILGEKNSISVYFGESSNLTCISPLYSCLTLALSGIYTPQAHTTFAYYLISNTHLLTFIRLIQEGPTSAAFSIFTMYFVRHHALQKHPERFNHLFGWLVFDTEMQQYGIGDQFVSNMIASTRTLIHSLWKKPQSGSDIQKVVSCITQIQNDAGGSDSAISLDPIALIEVFATVLWRLIPEAVVQEYQDSIYEMMGELADIISDQDQSFWTYSYRRSVEYSCIFFRRRNLADGKLRPKLKAIGQIWGSYQCD